MNQPFRLGFLTHLEGADDPRRIYQETLELFVAADQLGFDVVWVAQHHFKERSGCLPSPFPFLAVAAERTQRLRIGTSVVVLPLEHPLRVAEDAAVVDVLSNGRLELGVGSGGDGAEFQAFGVDTARRHTLTTEGLQLLQQALRGEPLGQSGQRLQPPAPTLIDRLWQSALSSRGAEYVAQQGVGLMLARAAWGHAEPTDLVQLPVAEAYRTSWHGQSTPPWPFPWHLPRQRPHHRPGRVAYRRHAIRRTHGQARQPTTWSQPGRLLPTDAHCLRSS